MSGRLLRTAEAERGATASRATRAVVVLPWERGPERRSAEARLAEAVGLARAIDLEIVGEAILPVRRRRPSTLLGAGQVDDLASSVEGAAASLVVVDAALTPIQQRNLERALHCKVIDRSGLILDIFGERAVTREGVLQVELAHLEYQRSRLVRSWTHLERQRGGFGFLGGPGETQIEADRRLIAERIVRLKRDLQQVRRTRGLHRSARRRVPLPVVALVGYTNAGKSTLFNALTRAGVVARDQLFATLDPTVRQLTLPSGRRVALSDTVGFISDLPTELVAAFRGTLEEVGAADLILHVRDQSHPDTAAQRHDVGVVIDGMAKDDLIDAGWRSRTIDVLNKIDLSEDAMAPPPLVDTVSISARTGEGLPALLAAIDTHLSADREEITLLLQPTDGARLAWLHEHGEVVERSSDDETLRVRVRLSPADAAKTASWNGRTNDETE